MGASQEGGQVTELLDAEWLWDFSIFHRKTNLLPGFSPGYLICGGGKCVSKADIGDKESRVELRVKETYKEIQL